MTPPAKAESVSLAVKMDATPAVKEEAKAPAVKEKAAPPAVKEEAKAPAAKQGATLVVQPEATPGAKPLPPIVPAALGRTPYSPPAAPPRARV